MEEMINKVCGWINFSYDSLNAFGKLCVYLLFVIAGLLIILLMIYIFYKIVMALINHDLKWREEHAWMFWDFK